MSPGRADVLLDTSVAVALVVGDHAAHAIVVEALAGRRLGLAGHAWFEAYSVLTRLPLPARRSPADVAHLLGANFPATHFPGLEEHQRLVGELALLDIAGGSVYDALVGAAARAAGLPLATRDERALPVYQALGVPVEVLRS